LSEADSYIVLVSYFQALLK